MNPSTAAARLSIALRPGAHIDGPAGDLRAFNALDRFGRFAREIHAEAGAAILGDIVRQVELHQAITRTTPPARPRVCDCGSALLPVGAEAVCDGRVDHGLVDCTRCAS